MKAGLTMIADRHTYLGSISQNLAKQWPDNDTVDIVCHGHSVPAGYFVTPMVNTFEAYPHLLHVLLKERFPYSVINVIVTAIGGENAERGAARIESGVLCHQPKVITIDYALNDRGISLQTAETAWKSMIEAALKQDCHVILMTPTWDKNYYELNDEWKKLVAHTEQVRRLAETYAVGLVDSFRIFEQHLEQGGNLEDLLSQINHPSKLGHTLVAEQLAAWFPEIGA